MAPGNVDYPDEFIDSWHKIVTKQEQDEVCKLLLEFIKRALRRVTESNDENVRKWTPETSLSYSLSEKEITHSQERKSQEVSKNKKQKFCCSQCGINHEARDFMRATLLHLIDHLERAKGFVEFMEENEFAEKQIFDEFVKNGGKYKCEN
jgi:hypothetical protein